MQANDLAIMVRHPAPCSTAEAALTGRTMDEGSGGGDSELDRRRPTRPITYLPHPPPLPHRGRGLGGGSTALNYRLEPRGELSLAVRRSRGSSPVRPRKSARWGRST